MLKTISITYFRNNVSLIADKVAKGLQFIVTRHSKPVFRVQLVDVDDDDDGSWEMIIDFTEGGKTEGMRAEDVLKLLKKIDG